MELLEIPGSSPRIDADVRIPGSKSLTNRSLLVAALARGTTTLENALFSEDSSLFANCLRQLGISVIAEPESARYEITGLAGAIPSKRANLFVGNAGTTARFITALLSLGQGDYRVDGVPAMRVRPMEELLTALRSQGAGLLFEGQSGYMPFTIRSRGFNGGAIRIKAIETSQQISALLMISPYARQDTTIEMEGDLVSKPYLDMTCQLMNDFGVQVTRNDYSSFNIKAGQFYRSGPYVIEPDASSSSYFFAAAALTGGRVRIDGLSKRSYQGDVRFVDVLARMGCQVNSTETYTEVIGCDKLRGIDVDLNDISDTMPTLSAIAPFASSPVTIRNVEHIRRKETDRIKAVATELQRLGINVEEFADGIKIYPGPLRPAVIETYDDHRIAMAFAIAGLKASGVVIKNPACTQKTFPDFFKSLFQMLG